MGYKHKIYSCLAVSILSFLVVIDLSHANSQDSSQSDKIIRLETIARLDGKDMAKEASVLLSKYGWEGWGHAQYDFGKISDEQAQEKKALYDAWVSGDGFKWIDPVWSFSGSDPKVVEMLSGCKQLTHPVVGAGTKFEIAPAPVVLPLDVGLGPVAIYQIDSSKISNQDLSGRYAIVIKFNELSKEQIADGKEIRLGVPLFQSSAYLYELDSCKYSRIANLGGSYLGGYTHDSIPRLTGAGYYKDKLVVYEIYDQSAAFIDSSKKIEIDASLFFVNFGENPSANPELELFYRP